MGHFTEEEIEDLEVYGGFFPRQCHLCLLKFHMVKY